MKSLGTVGFRDREKWSPHTFFRKDDRILHDRSTLYAKEDHESGDEFDPAKWGYLTDARGVTEALAEAQTATEAATTAAQEATERAGLASEMAEEAREAAEAANTEAEAAKEATGIFTENFSITTSDEFILAIVDAEGTLLWGIREDGTVYQPKGIPEETKQRLEEFGGFRIIDSAQYLFAMTDRNDNLVLGIDHKGKIAVNALGGVCDIEQTESKEYIFTIMDAEDNIILGVAKDGTIRIPKGIPEEQVAINKLLERKISDLRNQLANFKGGTGDWSDNGSMRIPIPRLAIVNILSGVMPTAKSGLGTPGVNCEIPCQLEFWDQQGNYAKIWVKLSCQGNSSMAFVKKNLAIDMFADSTMEDEYIIKFGGWVPQDSFHLKAYYTDAFRGVGVCSYQLYEEIMATRGMTDNAPYKEAFADNYETIANEYQLNTDLTENYDTGARCFPDGFPVAVYQNGEFYGLYSWQLKKHRDNFHMNKKTAEHVHLDGTITADSLWGGNILWAYFEIRNPKSLLNADGSKYDGDRPREIMGSDAEGYDKNDKDMKRCAKTKQYIIVQPSAIAGTA